MKTYTGSSNGLTVTVTTFWRVAKISITGTTTAELPTGAGYATIATISALSQLMSSDIVKYALYNTSYYGQISIEAAGRIRLGYSWKTSAGLNENLPSGTSLYIAETFVLN